MNGQACIRMRLTLSREAAGIAAYPDRNELFRNYPDLDEEDVRQTLDFAAANFADDASDVPAA
jgi:uncharacterized protein (DUF433 family)